MINLLKLGIFVSDNAIFTKEEKLTRFQEK